MKLLKWWQYFLPGPTKLGWVALLLLIAASRFSSSLLPCSFRVHGAGWHPTPPFLQLSHQHIISFNHWLTMAPSTSTLSTFFRGLSITHAMHSTSGSSLFDQLFSVLHASHPPTPIAKAWSTMPRAVPPPKSVLSLPINHQHHLLLKSLFSLL